MIFEHQITQHIRYGLTPLPFGTLASATSYMLGRYTQSDFGEKNVGGLNHGKIRKN